MLTMNYQNDLQRNSESPSKYISMSSRHKKYFYDDRRQKGGIAAKEFEEIHSSSTMKKHPNFSENRNHYKSIGWGVENAKLLNVPLVNHKMFSHYDRKSSLERTLNTELDTPLKQIPSFSSASGTPKDTKYSNYVKSDSVNHPSPGKSSFVNQIDEEYKSTGACGFLRLNGMFSNHVNKKLNVDSDIYYSMNMLGQKRTILNKLRASIANGTLATNKIEKLSISNLNKSHGDSVQAKTINRNDRQSVDNASINSDNNRVVLMYNRCSKLENWKDFQTKRYINHKQIRNKDSTLPVLKFHKEKHFKPNGSFKKMNSNERITKL